MATRKTPLMLQKERELGDTLEAIIRRLTDQGQSREEIARYLSVSYWTLTDWLRPDRLGARFETSIRFASEEQEELSSAR